MASAAGAPPPPPPNGNGNGNGNRGSGGGKSKHFTNDETDKLLALLLELLPLGQVAWQQVEDRFNAMVPEDRQRIYAQLQRRFKTLYSKKIPTGDPNIPPQVRLAKHINCRIQEAAQLVVAAELTDDDEDLANEDDPPNDDPPNDFPGIDTNPSDTTDASSPTAGVPIAAGLPVAAAGNATGNNYIGRGSSASRLERFRARGNHTKGGRGGKSPKGKKGDSDLIEAMFKLQAMKDKAERRRVKAKEKKDERQMKLFMKLAMAGVNAYMAGNINPRQHNRMMARFDSSSEEESNGDEESDASSISSNDSPPTRRRKERREEDEDESEGNN